jgi:hypothetical protein
MIPEDMATRVLTIPMRTGDDLAEICVKDRTSLSLLARRRSMSRG